MQRSFSRRSHLTWSSTLGTITAVALLSTTAFVCVEAQQGGTPGASAERARFGSAQEAVESPNQGTNFAPVKLDNGGKITLIFPATWNELANALLSTVRSTHSTYTRLFGEVPSFSSSIRLLDEGTFFDLTGAPSWTNAMYYHGQILIPIRSIESVDIENVHRSVRHEYTHAVVSALSGGRAPGWIDEGLAQWAEGPENPALRPALAAWLRSNEPVPLKFMQGGFTKLSTGMVPAAYAQSLMMTQSAVHYFGFSKVRNYFAELRKGRTKAEAFESGFGVTDRTFEILQNELLSDWMAEQSDRHSIKHPH